MTNSASGTKENPWKLKTPPQTSEYEMYKDIKDGKEIIVCTVGKTVLHYDSRCLNDLQVMLKQHGDWMELGGAEAEFVILIYFLHSVCKKTLPFFFKP